MSTLAQKLYEAYRHTTLVQIHNEDIPSTLEQACYEQDRFINLLNSPISAWKVGTGDTQYSVYASPIPDIWVSQDHAQLDVSQFSLIGIELEYAFRLNHIDAIHETMNLDDLHFHITEVTTAIEIVSTRLAGWPDLSPFLKMADLQSNGALILGTPQKYTAKINFLNPLIELLENKQVRSPLIGKNPAGDPRTLLPSFVAQQNKLGRKVTENHWITTGSLSGIFYINMTSQITGKIEGFSPVNIEFK